MKSAPRLVSGFAQVNGARLYYEMAGDGYPLVLIHAGIADSRMWDSQFGPLSKHFRVVRYDVRGFGKSDPAKSSFSHRDDLYQLLRFLKIDKTYLLGLSMGGGTAIDFAIEHPGMVAALIPVASGLSGHEASEELKERENQTDAAFKSGDLARTVELEIQTWVDGPNRDPSQVDRRVRELVREMDTYTTSRYIGQPTPIPGTPLKPPAISRLAKIRAPTMIIVGDQDVPDILEVSKLLESGIPNSRRVVVSGAAHMVNMEKPAEFNRLVFEFLQEQGSKLS